jgi:PPOX class probable F420-dependent enzyme
MATLDDLIAIAARESYLVVVSTIREGGTIQSSLVNAGVIPHPTTGAQVLAFVTYGPTKLHNLRERPQLTVTVRSGWEWMTAEGPAEVIGPDDPHPGVDAERLRLLLREVFTAAGGTHDDWDEYDRAMARERRTVVLMPAERVYSNPGR